MKGGSNVIQMQQPGINKINNSILQIKNKPNGQKSSAIITSNTQLISKNQQQNPINTQLITIPNSQQSSAKITNNTQKTKNSINIEKYNTLTISLQDPIISQEPVSKALFATFRIAGELPPGTKIINYNQPVKSSYKMNTPEIIKWKDRNIEFVSEVSRKQINNKNERYIILKSKTEGYRNGKKVNKSEYSGFLPTSISISAVEKIKTLQPENTSQVVTPTVTPIDETSVEKPVSQTVTPIVTPIVETKQSDLNKNRNKFNYEDNVEWTNSNGKTFIAKINKNPGTQLTYVNNGNTKKYLVYDVKYKNTKTSPQNIPSSINEKILKKKSTNNIQQVSPTNVSKNESTKNNIQQVSPTNASKNASTTNNIQQVSPTNVPTNSKQVKEPYKIGTIVKWTKNNNEYTGEISSYNDKNYTIIDIKNKTGKSITPVAVKRISLNTNFEIIKNPVTFNIGNLVKWQNGKNYKEGIIKSKEHYDTSYNVAKIQNGKPSPRTIQIKKKFLKKNNS